MKLSVIIPTRNERANIRACVQAFDGLVARGEAEVIVVDNASPDGTAELARQAGAKVFGQGPERCAQRNRGWRESAAAFVLFVDADMIVPTETQEEILRLIDAGYDALYVREHRGGTGWWKRARDFERSFYDATEIDAFRVMRKTLLEQVGGYDEQLVACEDWDLDRRILDLNPRIALTQNALIHNEARLTFRRHLEKKRYYAGTFDAYKKKWPDDARLKRQFSAFYRFFGIFFQKGGWKRVMRHPLLFATILAERFAVGLLYLLIR